MKKVGMFILVTGLLFIFVGAIQPTSASGDTTKWVDQAGGSDANDGNTEATAYATLQFAIDNSTSGISDNERSIISVKTGIYGSTGQTNLDGYSTAILIKDLDYLTIQAVPNHEPVVKPVTTVEVNIVSISIENSDHLVIDNIDSDQTIAQFDNWHVSDSNDLTVLNSAFDGGEDGIDFNTDLTTSLIANNTFVDVNTGNGDEVLDFTDGTYTDVVVQDNLFKNTYRQITIFPPTGDTASDFLVRRNVMDGTVSQEAIRLIGASDVVVENNVIMNSLQQGIYIDSGCSNITIRHNSFFNNDLEFEGNGELRTKVNTADIVIKNNIFYANGTNPVFETTATSLPGEDYNRVYNYTGEFTYGSNTNDGDPLFVSTTAGNEDLHLQAGSPAIEAGIDLGVVDDIEKNARPNPTGTDPDLGAYEFFVLDDEGPITSNVEADPNPTAVNGSVTLTANVDDTNTGGSNIASAEYSLDGGQWNGMAADDNFDSPIEGVNATFNAPENAGIYDLCVRGTDEPGNVGEPECIMLVVYDPDGGFVTGGGWFDSPVSILVWDQGFEADATGWFDIDDAWYGMVTRVASGTSGVTSSSGAYHAIFEGDASSGPFSRFDGYRDTWPGTWTAEVDVYLDPNWSAGTGFDYSVAANGSDGNHQRDYIFHVTKDTSTGNLLVAGSNNTNFAPREDLESINHHVVASAGWYTLQHVFYEDTGALAVDLNLLDASDTVLFTETRYTAADTIPGEVGGNRYAWFTFINVDGGIAVDVHQLFMPSPPGKANFGFVSKYKKGASVPTGSTEFVFQAADLNFHSNTYDWLVVTGSDFARYKGDGTINGDNDPNGDPFKFMLWAGDGTGFEGTDTFRIKIWYENSGSEIVVYDNGMDQPIGGGNIVVHTSKK